MADGEGSECEKYEWKRGAKTMASIDGDDRAEQALRLIAAARHA